MDEHVNKKIDMDKLNYDLAIEYAKISLKTAVSEQTVYDGQAPRQICEMEYLMSEFFNAYEYYNNFG